MADTLDTAPPGRRRRADARRSIDAIVSAARTVLGERPDASMEDIAAAAGVTRQTVYAHFPSRDALIAALLHALGAETVAAIDAARLDTAPPADALRQFLDIGWELIRRNPHLLGPALTRNPPGTNDRPPRRYRPARTDHPARPARRRLRPHAPRRLARRRHRRARSHRRRTSRRRTPHHQQGGRLGPGQHAATVRRRQRPLLGRNGCSSAYRILTTRRTYGAGH